MASSILLIQGVPCHSLRFKSDVHSPVKPALKSSQAGGDACSSSIKPRRSGRSLPCCRLPPALPPAWKPTAPRARGGASGSSPPRGGVPRTWWACPEGRLNISATTGQGHPRPALPTTHTDLFISGDGFPVLCPLRRKSGRMAFLSSQLQLHRHRL